MITRKEQARLKAMKRYLKLYYAAENKLQNIVMLASYITGTPVAFITLMDKEVQWITTRHGYPVEQMPRSTSFCTHTIEQENVFVVNDAEQDERFKNNPIVTMQPGAKFYAGTPLKSNDGHNIGTLCVMDVKPNKLDDEQTNCLKALSAQVSNLMELDLSMQLIKENVDEIEKQNATLRTIAHMQAHEFRAPLCTVKSVMDLIKLHDYAVSRDYVEMLEEAVVALGTKICSVVEMTIPAG